jgi:hypothetical protein
VRSARALRMSVQSTCGITSTLDHQLRPSNRNWSSLQRIGRGAFLQLAERLLLHKPLTRPGLPAAEQASAVSRSWNSGSSSRGAMLRCGRSGMPHFFSRTRTAAGAELCIELASGSGSGHTPCEHALYC